MSDFDFGTEGYRGKLKTKGFEGKPIYIMNWAIDVLLANITQASKLWGADNLVEVAKLDMKAAMRCVMNATDAEESANMMLHFVKSVTLDGKSLKETDLAHIFEAKPLTAIELFMHVIHSQYNDFFALGLAGELYPPASDQDKSKA